MTKTVFDSLNHTCLPKEDHLPDCARRDNQVKKGDLVDSDSSIDLNALLKYWAIKQWNIYTG